MNDMERPWPHPVRAWWTVAVFTLTYVVSFVDRTVISLLIEPIKNDLGLTDIQLALLQGAAFGIFYTLMGLPLGWAADRTHRIRLITIGAALWCLATAACGLSRTFGQLFLARIGVGVGEAALSPAALSTISDLFPKERRALPIGIYSMAVSLGAGLALLIGGAVIQLIGSSAPIELPGFGALKVWQSTFLIVGLSGLIVLPLLATLREPERRNELKTAVINPPLLPYLNANADFFARHYGGVAIYSILVSGVLAWAPAYFIRAHGWTPSEVGFRYGLVFLIFGAMGTVTAGAIAGWLQRRGVKAAALLVTGLGIALAAPPMVMAGISTDPWIALAWFALALAFFTSPGGVAVQVLQEACPNTLRGRASALYYFAVSIIGLTLGPLAVAWTTEAVLGDPAAVGKSLAVVAAIFAPAGGLLVLSGRKGFSRLTGEV